MVFFCYQSAVKKTYPQGHADKEFIGRERKERVWQKSWIQFLFYLGEVSFGHLKEKRIIKQAPMVIDESAILKAGK